MIWIVGNLTLSLQIPLFARNMLNHQAIYISELLYLRGILNHMDLIIMDRIYFLET